MQMKTTRELH